MIARRRRQEGRRTEFWKEGLDIMPSEETVQGSF